MNLLLHACPTILVLLFFFYCYNFLFSSFGPQDASGALDYPEFSFHLFGVGKRPHLDTKGKNIVLRVQQAIINSGGVSGLHGVTKILARMDTDGSKTLVTYALRTLK
jgi:hypothetical protein